jgi:outer membrane lipoprotein-sorting protein
VIVVGVGIGATALASAVGSGPTPPARPLADAIHDALAGPPVEGVSARITLSDHLLEGANLASGEDGQGGGGIASNPLINGASGRLWIAKDGRMRIELQSEKGDTQILYDGHTLSLYDASSNKLYRYTPKSQSGTQSEDGAHQDSDTHEPPSVAKIEEALDRLRKHVAVSDASPTDVAGHPAYTVRISPKESGSLIGGAELSFDSERGIPLRTAIYSSKSSTPVIELAATEIGYGSVDPSVFSFSPPENATVEQIEPAEHQSSGSSSQDSEHNTKLTHHGEGVTAIGVLETPAHDSGKSSSSLEQLPKVKIGATTANELRTELGTILTFERSGVRYVVAGAVEAAQVEALARSL